MDIGTKTKYGGIALSMEAIASVAGAAASECYGVVGLAPKKMAPNIASLVKAEDFVKGVYPKKTNKGYEVDVYLICAYGVKLSEIVSEVQKRVRYVLEDTFAIRFSAVNVFVQDLQETK